MNVGQLRQYIAAIPDETPVGFPGQDADYEEASEFTLIKIHTAPDEDFDEDIEQWLVIR